MSSQEGVASQSRPSLRDGRAGSSEQPIALVDSTASTDVGEDLRSRSQSPGWRKLARNVTKGSVRESINKRKYAKWSQERFGSAASIHERGSVEHTEPEPSPSPSRRPAIQPHETSEALDFAHPQEPAQPARLERKKVPRPKRKKESVIDILYENQRGSFFCGIPLYSHSSLLQFDPGPWVTKDFKDSAVNITNAQVPDPSWQWDWKHWYVDMSGDVDEDGWQYSFAFFGNFAWHGTHPWFHSYVRRRRWVRKRVKKASLLPGKAQPSSMSAAHKLNADYFTIHSKRVVNDGLPFDEMSQLGRTESYVSYRNSGPSEEETPEDINNIASLLKAIRLASVDREKLDAIKRFLDAGGEELHYLKEQIPEIMSFLVFQNSRRQLLEILRQKMEEAESHRKEHIATSKPEGEAEARRIDNLLQAAEVALGQIGSLDYWSDRKQVLLLRDDNKTAEQTPLKTIFDEPADNPKPDLQPAASIKGIPDDAEIGHDPTKQVVHAVHSSQHENDDQHENKGKLKESAAEDVEEAGSHLRLDRDQLFIPDKEA